MVPRTVANAGVTQIHLCTELAHDHDKILPWQYRFTDLHILQWPFMLLWAPAQGPHFTPGAFQDMWSWVPPGEWCHVPNGGNPCLDGGS